ncbi:MAG: hypothetical protein KC777_11485 [Cyanobacteria bacterium HKST-UBA02]|nr:hypothetical protein [Cyanobacteria bacterium HKST-UBA02]
MSDGIRTVVTFQASKFVPVLDAAEREGEEPEMPGRELCGWMIEELTRRGFACDSEPGSEDFGWYFNFDFDNEKYCFVCGLRPGDENEPDLWTAWIEKAVGFFASIIGRRNRNINEEVPKLVHRCLDECDDISSIEWFFKRDFDRRVDAEGSASP